MTMFGRDSIFTSLQALPFTPELAATTLRVLGERQGTRVDDFRDEDPGRILHEMRYGEMTAFEERPHSPYYGTADATPLFVVLLDEYERWTGDTQARPRARARGARRAATGSTSTPTCRATATSRTSGATRRPASRTSAGRTPGTRSPTATAACPASRGRPASCRATPTTRRCAARGWPAQVWNDAAFADRARARRRPTSSAASTATSGSTDGEYFALALDADGSQVDALTSNIGHLLWSGIVDKSKAKAVVAPPDGPAAVLGLGRAHAGRGRGPLQPDRLPRRHGLAVRQLVHRLGPAPLRLQGGGGADRGRHPRRGRVLRRPAARGVRRLRRER